MAYQDPTPHSGSGTFGMQSGAAGGLSSNVTLPSSRAHMYLGLGLGNTEDWSQYNIMDNNIYGQMNDGRNQHNRAVTIQGGHMSSGRNLHQLPFSQHDPMMNGS